MKKERRTSIATSSDPKIVSQLLAESGIVDVTNVPNISPRPDDVEAQRIWKGRWDLERERQARALSNPTERSRMLLECLKRRDLEKSVPTK
jgi:hypothetical protein